jgi:hypothetical protein
MSDFDPIGSILGYVGQQETNAANVDIANKQMDFQERMSNTAYQRQVADMQAAGLNPMLAYMKGGGASTPSGSTTTVTSPLQGALQGGLTSATTAKTKVDTVKAERETDVLGFTAAQIQENTRMIGKTIDKMAAEIGSLESQQKTQEYERERITAVIKNLAEETKLLKQRSLSEEQTTKVLTETAVQAKNKSYISDMELKAILDTDMIGVYAREIKPVTDIAGDFVGGIVDRVMSRLPSLPKTVIHKK